MMCSEQEKYSAQYFIDTLTVVLYRVYCKVFRTNFIIAAPEVNRSQTPAAWKE